MQPSSSKSKYAAPKGHSKSSDQLQIIDGRDIDPAKLADTLEKRFGKGNYKVEVC
jgi:hypothetical protein